FFDNDLSGEIPDELGNLTNLRILFLSWNRLTGTIPPTLGNLTNLQLLWLDNNQLHGAIPPELANVSALQMLTLNWNQLTGSILPELSNLTNLEHLGLGGNPLTGTIPSTLGNLANLQVLDLYDNDLSGTIPVELANLANLRELVLSWNQLEGALPVGLGNLANLQHLEVAGNPLTGSLPTTLTNLTQLTRFYFDLTNLCEPSDPTFQSWLAGLAELRRTNVRCSGPFTGCANVTEIPQTECEALVALYNGTDGPNWTDQENWLVTDTPCSWSGVSCTPGVNETFSQVTELNKNYANLIGPIPSDIGALPHLRSLYLSGNQLTTVPAEIGNLTSLNALALWDNQITVIPPEIGNLTTLTLLDLWGNQLSALPVEIGNLTNLFYLSLWDNQLAGLPSEISNLTNLNYLYLWDNQFTVLPTEIGALTNLIGFAAGSNQLTTLPPWIGNLVKLQTLSLGGNQITTLPPEIGNLTQLTSLYLWENQLTTLPGEIGALTKLTQLDVSNNQLRTLPAELGNLSGLEGLSLQNNQLPSLPAEIGNLSNLQFLYLWGNRIGSIPTNMNTLMNLESFDISANRLSGTLPEWLGLLSLYYLNLSDNIGLVGPLPQSLTNYSQLSLYYIGTNLCIPNNPDFQTWLSSEEVYATGNNRFCDTVTIRKRADSPRSPEGATNGYTIEIYNPRLQTLYLTALVDTLPSVASYQAGSTSGFTTSDPTISEAQNTLLWEGSFAIAPTSAITIHFSIGPIDPSNVGIYYNDVAALVQDGAGTALPPASALNVAPIEVPPPTVATNVNIGTSTGSTTVDPATGQIDVTMPWGNRSDLAISSQASCPTPPGGTPTAVTLWHNFNSYPMSESPAGSGSYVVTIPAADVDDGDITVEVTCNGVLIENTIGEVRLYDPSGIISNATTGDPIENAKVTLYRVPGWRPDTADETRECRTVDTRGAGWSQEAPTDLGIVMDAALEPAEIDPQINPQYTNNEGRYGWNVVEGCWYIVIEAAGYQTKVSPVVGVPPEVTDLDVALTPIAGAALTLSISQSAGGVTLQWSSHPTATHYLVHRSNLPGFTPTLATEIYTTTAGTTTYLDTVRVPGDGVDAFYQVVATDGSTQWTSNQVGKLDYALNNSGGNYSLIGIPFADPAITNAASLAAHIGNVGSLLQWNPTTQTFRFFIPPATGDNFAVNAGDAIFVTINSGGPANVSFVGAVEAGQLPLTPGGYNFLSLPHEQANLTNAAAVATDIGGVTAMLSWNLTTQTFRFFSPAGGGDNFAVGPGEAFIVLLGTASPTTWPADSQ
ncbi:MAG: leucine-rich repeat domain-containing protein, partial [Caldilineaceae bacterium]|nr:leucine-rich repeat domain-containing protein [Caldilineaceae bacterium]